MEKVTIITPVYNGEEYVQRYLESIINQTYKNIQLIIIDDGSKDNTKDIIKKYIELAEDGIEIQYIYQENAGQAAAVANGIKYVKGTYLAWADSDDYYELNAIENMVNFLEEHREYAIVRCNAIARSEEDLQKIVEKMIVKEENKEKTDIFEDCIFVNGINSFIGIYMMRFSEYKKNNPNLIIYPGREGQNWQLLLPALYNNKCGYLERFVYNYVVRKKSHSHMKRAVSDWYERMNGKKKIILETLKILRLNEDYIKIIDKKIEKKYEEELFYIFVKDFQKEEVKRLYKKLKEKTLKKKIYYLFGTSYVLNKIYLWLSKIKNEKPMIGG